jgi:hypothetical protein
LPPNGNIQRHAAQLCANESGKPASNESTGKAQRNTDFPGRNIERPRSDSNRRITDLQSVPLVRLGTRPYISSENQHLVFYAVARCKMPPSMPIAANDFDWSALTSGRKLYIASAIVANGSLAAPIGRRTPMGDGDVAEALLRIHRHAEALDAVAEVGRLVVAVGAARVDKTTVPRPAAHHPLRTGRLRRG